MKSHWNRSLYFFLTLFMMPAFLEAKEIPDSFKPAWWCRGAHCQTIYGGLFRSLASVSFRRERLELPDGDFVDLDWREVKANAPILMILPGLGGSSRDSYVLALAQEGLKAGWNVVVLNPRGSSGEPNRLYKTHHGGRTGDLDFAVRHLLEKKNPAEIYIAGYSLGGNILLKWLGEKGSGVPSQIKKAAAISVPYDLAKACEMLDRGFNRKVYTRNLLKGLKAQALAKAERLPGILDKEMVRRAKTFKVYDREVTARLNGFKDEKDYWAQSSSAYFLDKIQVRVLLIHAANDPFLPGAFLPLEKIKHSRALTLLLTKDGGHLGFVSGVFPGRAENWLEKTILSFFEAP